MKRATVRPEDNAKQLYSAAKAQAKAKYVLSLFVAGSTPRSNQAIHSITEICELYLKKRYELDVVDIYGQPEAVKEEQIVVAPTLIKRLPLPLRRLIGDMLNKEKVLVGLDLRPKV